MTLPDPVVRLLKQPVSAGTRAQAFPFVTVDEAGFPHVALLSSVEVSVGPHDDLHVVLAGAGTRANLTRSGQATLLAVEGTTAHSLKVRLRRSLELEGLLGAVLEPVAHKADSLGLALSGIGFVPTEELAQMERWDRSARVLAALRSGG